VPLAPPPSSPPPTTKPFAVDYLPSPFWYGLWRPLHYAAQWAPQFLSLNLTRACARHLHTARARLSSPPASPHTGFNAVFVTVYLLLYVVL
jgi:hypothetical protein